MKLRQFAANTVNNTDTFREAARLGRPQVLKALAGPAFRGLLLQRAKNEPYTDMPAAHSAQFNWDYESDRQELRRLYDVAKASQWNADEAVDWSIEVDPYDPGKELLPERILPIAGVAAYRNLPRKRQQKMRHDLMSWILSQFLHGEQGALLAACQVTESVAWIDGKLYGSTQVMDEGRHVEVFSRYLDEKLNKTYEVNDFLYVIIDALMTDSRWDIKFLGMQIMIEGLALGAFGTIRSLTREPLLREMLRYVITDEARHVHYGVVALKEHYGQLNERERQEREDWAFEIAVLMRNRFLAHEFYEEQWAHMMSRAQWDKLVLESPFMDMFRQTMFKRLIPNLKRIHLLSDRIRPHYEALGLLTWEHGKAAPDLDADDLLRDETF
jgi:hypothetical protein